MSDFSELLKIIKKTSYEAVEASKPMNVIIGKVISVTPLKINIEQKLTLSSLQLIISRSASHLELADEVILLRVQGGQKYVVMDRVYCSQGGNSL